MMKSLLVALLTTVTLVCPVAAMASPGDPPPGFSPVAQSIYRAQFALCSLDTLTRLAATERLSITNISDRAAASQLAARKETSVGLAAVQGCRNGLLYRARDDRALMTLRQDLAQRITAEKYVAGVYMLVVFLFFSYVLIHAAKLSRLERESTRLAARLEAITEKRSPA